MKKNYKYVLAILLFSLLIMIPVIGNYYKGHDTYFHVANIESIASKISITNLLVQEPLPNIANDFGYGTRFFYPPLPQLLAAYITSVVGNVVVGMRITEWLSFFLSGITFFLLGLKLFKDKKTSLLLSFIYMVTPYHLSEVFIRDAFSEMFVPVFIPLIILGLLYLVENKHTKFMFYFTLGYTIAVYSHLAMAIYFTLMILVTFFIIYFKKIFTKKNILYLLSSALLILALTCPFWAPLLEIKLRGNYGIFIPYYITAKGDLRYSTIKLFNLFKVVTNHNYTGIRYHLALYTTIILVFSLLIFIKDKLYKNKTWLFIVIFTSLACIMVTSIFPWYYTPGILETLQFPWRISIYVAFGAIMICGLGIVKLMKTKYNKLIFVGLTILILGGSFYYTYHAADAIVDINNIDYSYGVGNQAEYLPKNTLFNKEYYDNRSNDIVITSGSGETNIIENDTPSLTFEVKNSSNLTIELPRLYYMGYSLKKDNNAYKLTESEYGFLETTVDDGIYTLEYVGTPVMHISNLICLLTGIGIIIYIIKKKYLC